MVSLRLGKFTFKFWPFICQWTVTPARPEHESSRIRGRGIRERGGLRGGGRFSVEVCQWRLQSLNLGRNRRSSHGAADSAPRLPRASPGPPLRVAASSVGPSARRGLPRASWWRQRGTQRQGLATSPPALPCPLRISPGDRDPPHWRCRSSCLPELAQIAQATVTLRLRLRLVVRAGYPQRRSRMAHASAAGGLELCVSLCGVVMILLASLQGNHALQIITS